MQKFIIYLLVFIFNVNSTSGQGRNANWCFGDSAGIKFTSGGIIGISSVLQSQEASASISDSSGNLLFYTGSIGGNSIFYSNVYNYVSQLLLNGDSVIASTSSTQGHVICPNTTNPNTFIIFSIGFLPPVYPYLGLFSSSVDLNSGNGVVINKNHIIDTSLKYCEKMIAIKHGNGSNWWLINHEQNTDQFIIRFIQNDTTVTANYQSIGSTLNSLDGVGQMVVNPVGNKISIVGQAGTINVFDFDRCTGLLSNYADMSDNPLPGFGRYYGASISSQNLLYYSTWDSLWQINLNAANPVQTKQLVYADQNSNVCMGQHQIGPNGKIYIANAMPCGYPSTITDSLNTHLTVINQPDSIGPACNVLPYFQPIGGARSYLGLPNMPNYDLGPFAGSSCDTLTSVQSESMIKSRIDIVPNPVTDHFKISSSIKNNPDLFLEIKIFNSKGQLVFEDKIHKIGDEINFNKYDAGLYAITLSQKGRQWFCKFVKL